MKLLSAVLVAAMTVPAVASAQVLDLGPDVSGYTRFIVYPHLQKGWESVQRGDRERAFSELERARALAPDNAAVALQLAAAYRQFGELARADALLRDQLKRTPADARVKTALAEIDAASRPAPSLAPDTAATPAVHVEAVPEPSALPVSAAPVRPAVRRAIPVDRQRAPYAPLPQARAVEQARFAAALRDGHFPGAATAARALLRLEPAAIDAVSFTLVDAGASREALSLLLHAYPFGGVDAVTRDSLMHRLIPLVQQHRAELSVEDLSHLRGPLDTPALRSLQGAMWAGTGDCDAVRAVLGDLSASYGHEDWMRLGDCVAAGDPALARRAYATAHAMVPGSRASASLAYAAFAAGEYRVSFDAWKSMSVGSLSQEDLLAAATTGLAADEDARAVAWLQAYQTAGHPLGKRYWSLLGRGHTRTDAAAAMAAFERAVALQPDLDDLLRLAQLETLPGRRVQLLEQAVTLSPANADTHAALGYAYARAGRPADALRAFQRSAAANPANGGVQMELGFAHWRTGRTADAARAFEAAYKADPTNMMVARQLVYAEQRLANNGAARRYAEHVLDTPGALASGTAVTLTETEQADMRFGFRRLHEDLGRRVTVNLDGFSGTRLGTGAAAAQPGSYFRSYSQIEADVRLGKEPVRNGRTVSAYARVFGDGGEARSPLPSRNTTLGAGLRWKPWRSQVVYFAAEGQNGLEDTARRDVLLRASASFLNGGRFSDDWHPARKGWFSQNLYLDAARYVESEFAALTADYRTSYHARVADGRSLEPYTHVQFNVSGVDSVQRDVRAGGGVRVNLWYGGSRYDADPHKFSLGVEFQHAFETYLLDRNGIFLTLGSRW